jgi:hypothetical protein
MNRAESAVFIERGIHNSNYTPSQPANQEFDDVSLSEWYAKWADGLWDDGFTAGCGTDPLVYCPMQEHSRTEGTVFFLRMLNGATTSRLIPAVFSQTFPLISGEQNGSRQLITRA